ncbi:MAG: hypothetical protein A3D92_14065 [Bacteroidetes bacterium RIFCSPHIGHO2_02_FULL_44_7]|nr:MAG: hypothetical protein A3D92_14065 [Bacteroidetes bacterium RIFCSPHIGHO2_02_FULL_44_7]
MMNKEKLIQTMIQHQRELVNEFAEKVATVHSMVDLDEGDTLDPEDFSHQHTSGEMEQLMRVQLNRAERCLESLHSLDVASKKSVMQGAYVETDQFNCLVCFATAPFECCGKTVIGISKESPLYAAMIGKHVNESFSFAGKKYTINTIL